MPYKAIILSPYGHEIMSIRAKPGGRPALPEELFILDTDHEVGFTQSKYMDAIKMLK